MIRGLQRWHNAQQKNGADTGKWAAAVILHALLGQINKSCLTYQATHQYALVPHPFGTAAETFRCENERVLRSLPQVTTNDKWNDESIKKWGPTRSGIFHVKMSNFCPRFSQMTYLLPLCRRRWGSECRFWQNKSFEVFTPGSGTGTISCSFHFHISGAAFSFESVQIKPGGPLTSLLWKAQIEKARRLDEEQ